MQNENMFNLFYAKVLLREQQLSVNELKLPRKTRNMQDYFQMQHNVQADGLDAESPTFQRNSVSEHYKFQYCECIGTLAVNLDDRFQQETIKILSDVETFFAHCLKLRDSMNEQACDELLSSAGIVCFKDDVELLKL